MSTAWVIDASAVLTYLRAEPGYPRTKAIMEGVARGESILLSSVILCEVLNKTTQRRGRRGFLAVRGHLRLLPLRIEPFTETLAEAAAMLQNDSHLSLGDAAVAALARREKGRVVTRDPDFLLVEGLVAIEWITGRPPKR